MRSEAEIWKGMYKVACDNANYWRKDAIRLAHALRLVLDRMDAVSKEAKRARKVLKECS